IRSSANGPNVQLDCSDCHRPPGGPVRPWPYAVQSYRAATVSYMDSFRQAGTDGLSPRHARSGRELMEPGRFATACAACHLLTFDKRFDEGVPHDKPEVIHAFLLGKFSTYIAAHPAELRETEDPARDLTGKPLPPRTRIVTAARWIQEKVTVAE